MIVRTDVESATIDMLEVAPINRKCSRYRFIKRKPLLRALLTSILACGSYPAYGEAHPVPIHPMHSGIIKVSEIRNIRAKEGAAAPHFVNVQALGAKCDGSTDDSTAFQSALTLAARGNFDVVVPAGSACVINSPLSVSVGGSTTLTIRSSDEGSLHGSRLIFPSGFAKTGITFTLTGAAASGATYGGFAVNLSGLSFFRAGTDTGGTAVAIQVSSGGSATPTLKTNNLTFTSSTGGSWSVGLALSQANVTSLDDTFCTNGFKGTCVSYDTSNQISVEHHIKDLYINGASGTGSTGLSIGHTGMTESLQGFTIRGLSCTGSDYCINAQSAGSGAIDEIAVSGSQFNSVISGIRAIGANTLMVTNSYFIQGSKAVDFENGDRLVLTGNTFYLGPDSVSGVTNESLYTKTLGGDPSTGSIVSGNLFTNLYGVPIYLDSGSNYVTVTGNTCLGNDCVNDQSGNTANSVVDNFGGGNRFGSQTTPQYYAGVKIGPESGGYPLTCTADGNGNGDCTTNGPNGAGILELGPNLKLDGSTTVSNPLNLYQHVLSGVPSCSAGQIMFITDARNTGEATGAGTGAQAYCNGKSKWLVNGSAATN